MKTLKSRAAKVVAKFVTTEHLKILPTDVHDEIRKHKIELSDQFYLWNDGKYKLWYRGTQQLNREYNYDCYGLKHGLTRRWYFDGQISHWEMYYNGELHGVCKKWWPNGKLQKLTERKFGRLHGIYKKWRSDGTLSDFGHYENGNWHGLWKMFDKHGKLQAIYEYKEGRRIGHYNFAV